MIRWRLVWPAGQAEEVGIGFLGHDTFKHPFLEAEIPGIHGLGFVIGRTIAPYRDCTGETLDTAILGAASKGSGGCPGRNLAWVLFGAKTLSDVLCSLSRFGSLGWRGRETWGIF